MQENEIIIFEDQNIKLEVNIQDETVWLNTKQMSTLFDRDYKTIRKHIQQAMMEELQNEVVVAKFETTTKHGAIKNKKQTRYVEYYNLDVIISVGYRVKSKKGIIFRKWANQILKDYLLKGYTINNKRLEYLEKTIKLIDIASRVQSEESNDIIKIINKYSKAYVTLDNYDYNRIKKPQGKKDSTKITYNECITIINKMKENNSSSNLFALEKDNGLESIINNIYLSYDDNDLYPTIEEKASNFLYLVIKNHPFIDGNKRVAAILFIYFLNFYNILYKDNIQIIDNNTLVSITLLIAQSNPNEKGILIDLVMNFLAN